VEYKELTKFVLIVDTRFDVFYFSSRRRHTRSKRDWSSDVCSSDLHLLKQKTIGLFVSKQCSKKCSALLQKVTFFKFGYIGEKIRSEERRVGKESRDRWWGVK